jgi:malate dehydrogenase (oxaloacetate-decarboxylating)(NADP+)
MIGNVCDENLGQNQKSSKKELTPALAYHAYPAPGKFKTTPTKPLSGSSDLALAYSPGVSDACQVIAQDPGTASDYTMRQHLVAVISNGTAVLGLGNIGPLAAKPVMEGKAVLFQVFSGLNAIDLEINEQDPEKLIEIIASLAPSFGAINLEDIRAPDCFHVETALQQRLDIPVFHDDQHGTAITVAAAVTNALQLVGKSLKNSRCVVAGAGAGALACVGLLVELGMSKSNVTLCDTKGVIHSAREDLSEHKKAYAQDTAHRSLEQAMVGADIFLGLSGPATVTPQMIVGMAPQPIVFALANPIPEIWPHEVLGVRPDAYVGTGRSDLPNQVNNVLCFPYIFRGAVDAGARSITLPMKKACVQALSTLAKQGYVDVTGAYGGEIQDFGAQYFLPKPFDLRLGVALPLAVAQAAVDCGAAPAFDLDHYRQCLTQRAYQDFLFFKTRLCHPRKKGTAIPKLGYWIETQDALIPQAVVAAARAMHAFDLARPFFVGHKNTVAEQLQHDILLKNAEIYSPEEYAGMPVAGQCLKVYSHPAPDRQNCARGWVYQDQLHIYASAAPESAMINVLEQCGCVMMNTAVGSSSTPSMLGHTPISEDSGPRIMGSTPHFGGLTATHKRSTFWHTGQAPSWLGDAWLEPIPMLSTATISISSHDSVRCCIENSSWALFMQEIAM